ncbi:MAG: GNAT family N-acetyltransferase [Candidatus Thorarchaeota archaeon]
MEKKLHPVLRFAFSIEFIRAIKRNLEEATVLIEEVPAGERHRLSHLFAEQKNLHLICEGILREGVGQAFTDNIQSPSTALLARGPIVFLSGDEKNPAASELLNRVEQKRLIFIPDDKWKTAIENHWGDKLRTYPRTRFLSDNLDIEYMREIQEGIPVGMKIRSVTRNSIGRISDQAKGIVRLLFSSLDQFLETNFGFCIESGKRIVSLALAATPIYNGHFEIHIETDPDHQKMGLAAIVCAKLIEYSLEHGLTPHWDADNPPSAKLATKLGFSSPEQYNAYFWIDG